MAFTHSEKKRNVRIGVILLGLILPPLIILTFFRDQVLPSAPIPAERFQSFNSEVTVDIKGDAQVAESIVLLAGGDQVKHGFRRFLPRLLATKDNQEFKYTYNVKAIIQDEEDLPLNVLDRDVAQVATLGNADVDLSVGAHSYFLRYDVTGLVQLGEKEDHLLWNVTGNYPLMIDNVSAIVRLPAAISPASVKIDAYRETLQFNFEPADEDAQEGEAMPTPVVTKEFIRETEGLTSQIQSDGSIMVTSTKPIEPNQALFIHLTFPGGAIANNAGATS